VANERRDYVERLIEELARVVSDLVARLRVGPPAAAEVTREVRAAQDQLLGPLAATLPRVDAASAVALLRDARRVEAYVSLLRVEAEARRLAGEETGAEELAARARALEVALGAGEGP